MDKPKYILHSCTFWTVPINKAAVTRHEFKIINVFMAWKQASL